MLQVDSQTWSDVIGEEKKKGYFLAIMQQVSHASQKNHVYPPHHQRFNALVMTPFHQVKVVILGQDPYHGPGQAHGLSFSVPKGVAKPPSLVNIFKETHTDVHATIPGHGCLETWAKQGVLLLNSCLSVDHGNAGSHRHFGWETFTDKIIESISEHHKHIVFMLWGAYAQKKSQLIDQDKHLILCAPHPSPLSAHRGFLGCKHFSKTNQYLLKNNIATIDWQINE